MNTIVSLWVAAPVLGTALVLLWVVLRAMHRNNVTELHTRYAQQLRIADSHAQQTKQQIGQLQHDLAASRLQIKQLSTGRAARPQGGSRAKETLERMLDDASASRRHLPIDGFADTQPSAHSERDIDLLLR